MTREVKTKEEYLEKWGSDVDYLLDRQRADLDAVIAAAIKDKLEQANVCVDRLAAAVDATNARLAAYEPVLSWAQDAARREEKSQFTARSIGDGLPYCIHCGGLRSEGHRKGCDLALSLSRARELGIGGE